ncbi:hypothetical protein M422DRAFT_246089 [Sphaerobolus stellatus SS14]|nr:hypothetical protein M422DRAFT_246089 [Sphaerobolus stellatus SS14]
MSHHCSGRRTQAEELSTQAVEGDEPISGLAAGDLTDPPSASVDPQQRPEVLVPEHPDEPHTVPRLYQAGYSRPLEWLDLPTQPLRRVAGASGTATQGSYSPQRIDQGSESWQNLSDAPSEPDHVSPDGGDTDEEENFTIPASEVNILRQEYTEFINLKDNAEIVLSEAMEATERLNTVFSHIRTSMNRMSLRMKELFLIPVTKSSGKTHEPGNNLAHDKAAAKAAIERIVAQTTIIEPVPGTGTNDHGVPESIEHSQCSIREPQSIDMNALREEIKETISATIKEKLCSDADSVTTVSQSILALDANAQYWSDLSNKAARRSHRALELQFKLAEEKVNTLLHKEAPEEVLLEAAREA